MVELYLGYHLCPLSVSDIQKKIQEVLAYVPAQEFKFVSFKISSESRPQIVLLFKVFPKYIPAILCPLAAGSQMHKSYK